MTRLALLLLAAFVAWVRPADLLRHWWETRGTVKWVGVRSI